MRGLTLLLPLPVDQFPGEALECVFKVTLNLLVVYKDQVADDVSIHGPITQSQFLGSLGINFRAEALLQNGTEEQVESLRTGYSRLVGEGEAPFWEGPNDQEPIVMGTKYMAMTIVNKKQGTPAPFQ